MSKGQLSAKSKEMLEQFKAEAHQRVLKREFVQFRVDEEMMDLLLKVAEYKRQPYGVMVREWVQERLAEEVRSLPLPAVTLPSGQVLTERSLQQEIEEAVLNHQQGLIKLGAKEYRTLMDWLLDRHLAAKYSKRA